MELIKCLEKMSNKELDRLYNKYDVSDIEKLNNSITISLFDKISFLNDDELEALRKGFDSATPCEYFLENDIVLEVKGKYVVCDEIINVIESMLHEFSLKRKSIFVSFYLEVFGMISIKDMIRVCKETGVSVSLKDIKEIVKENYMHLEDNILYYDFTLGDFPVLGKEYKIFDNHMIASINELIFTYYPYKMGKIIEKRLPKSFDADINEFCSYFCTYVMSSFDSPSDICDALADVEIKLSKAEKKEFIDLIIEMGNYLPSWIYKGNPLVLEEERITDEEYYAYVSSLVRNNNINDSFINYVYAYVCLNGVINVDKLISILKEYHCFDVNFNDVIVAVNSFDFFFDNNYISMLPFDKFLLEVIKYKKENLNYRKIEDPLNDVLDYNNKLKNIEKIIYKLNLNDSDILSLKMFAVLGVSNASDEEDVFKEIISNVSCENEKSIIKELREALEDFPRWGYNGFTKKQLDK